MFCECLCLTDVVCIFVVVCAGIFGMDELDEEAVRDVIFDEEKKGEGDRVPPKIQQLMTMTAYHVLAQRKQMKKQRKDESLMKFNDEIFYKIPPGN